MKNGVAFMQSRVQMILFTLVSAKCVDHNASRGWEPL